MTASLGKYEQTPTERRDYTLSYADWLQTGETVVSATFLVVAQGLVTPAVTPLQVTDHSIDSTGKLLQFWVQYGDAGENYNVYVTATTSIGQIKEDLVVFTVYKP